MNDSNKAAHRTDLSKTLVSMIVASTVALKEARAVGSAEGVLRTVDCCELSIILKCTGLI